MELTAALLMFVVLMTSGSLLAYRRYARPARMLEQIDRNTVVLPKAVRPSLQIGEDEEPERLGGVTRIVQQIGSMVRVSPAEAKSLRLDLMQAGFRGEKAVPTLYGLKVLGAAAFFLFALALRGRVQSPMMQMLLLVAGGAAGFTLPSTVLHKMVAKRQETIRLSMPDALDMLVVSVEAGLGLDQAIQYVSRELEMTHRALSEELQLVTLEMRAGKRRADALRNLAERTGEDEMRKLVAILVQNDRFGTSMSESLRTHSEYMRTKRRQEAEERAAKVGVKLVFPIFFFILPSMMVVSAGPALLAIFKRLMPMMNGVG